MNESSKQSIFIRESYQEEKNPTDCIQVPRSNHNIKARRLMELNNDSNQQNSQQNDDSWTAQEKQKLNHIIQRIQFMKDQKRAHDLVMNLPSRMIKSFNKVKFQLLDDKSYYYDDKFFQQSILGQSNQQNREEKEQKFPSSPSSNHNNNNIVYRKSSLIGIVESQISNKQKKSMKQIIFKEVSRSFLNLHKSTKKCFIKGLEYFDKIPIISPSNKFKLIWDILNIIVLLTCMLYLPIAITFHINLSSLISKQLTFIMPLFLILDVLINMNTGYFDKGQVIKSRIKIINNFFKEKILREVISIIPFLIMVYQELSTNKKYRQHIHTESTSQQQLHDLLQMVFFMKILTLSSTLWKLEERFNLRKKLLNLLQLAKLLFTILLINHLFACLWVYVAKIEISNGQEVTWMSYDNIHLKNWSQQYISAFYFTTLTMITVGYGDILPRNEIEMILCTATMMLACGVFGYMINQIGVIFNSIYQVDNQIKNQISQIQQFMSKKNINTNLQYQIREYLEYYWREQSEMNQEQEQIIIEQLSESLRSKLLFEANKIVLKDSPIFKYNFSKAVIEQTVPLIKEIKFSPESYIFLKGVQDDGAIYFIENGSVEIVLERNKNSKILFSLNKGDSFGAYSFFTGFPRINFIRSKEFTTVLKIGRKEFLQLIQRFQEDYETFCNIRDSICYLKDYQKIGEKCKSCGSNYHLVNDCQYIHFIPKKARIIKSYNDQFNFENSIRTPYLRRIMKKDRNQGNTLSIIQEVNKQVEIFIDMNQSLLDLSDHQQTFSDGYYELENNDSKKYYTNKSESDCNYQNHYVQSKKGNNFLDEIGISNNGSIYIQQSDIQYERKNQFDMSNSPQTKQKNAFNFMDQQNENSSQKISQSKSQIDRQYSLRPMKSQEMSERQGQSSQINIILNQQGYQVYENPLISLTQHESNLSLSFNRIQQEEPEKSIHFQWSKSNLQNQQNSNKNKFKFRQNSSDAYDQCENLSLPKSKQAQMKSSTDEAQKSKKFSNSQNREEYTKKESFQKNIQILISQLNNQQQRLQSSLLKNTEYDFYLEERDLIFDKMKQFVKYKPRFNFSTIISRFNQLQDQKRKIYKRNIRISKQKGSCLLKSYLKIGESDRSLIDGMRMTKFQTNSAINNISKYNKEIDPHSSKYNCSPLQNETDLNSIDKSLQNNKSYHPQIFAKSPPIRQKKQESNIGIKAIQNYDQNETSFDRFVSLQLQDNTFCSPEKILIEDNNLEEEIRISSFPCQQSKNQSNLKQRYLNDQ